MTLVDSSVWAEHFLGPVAELSELLETERALVHPMVLGELILRPRRSAQDEQLLINLSLLETLPQSEPQEVFDLITRFKLWGRGIGLVDCHLMAAARAADCHLLTRDKALRAAWLHVRPKH